LERSDVMPGSLHFEIQL